MRIITTEDTYYIGNEDFRNIDRKIILMDIDEGSGGASPTDASSDDIPDPMTEMPIATPADAEDKK